jgi:hypothetical protein
LNNRVPRALPVRKDLSMPLQENTDKASGNQFPETVSTIDLQRVAYSWKGGISATEVPSIIF